MMTESSSFWQNQLSGMNIKPKMRQFTKIKKLIINNLILTASNFKECSGTTRSSWSAVNNMVDGYWVTLSAESSHGLLTLCRGEYLRKTIKQQKKWKQLHTDHLHNRSYIFNYEDRINLHKTPSNWKVEITILLSFLRWRRMK